jgi:hypothetical protein
MKISSLIAIGASLWLAYSAPGAEVLTNNINTLNQFMIDHETSRILEENLKKKFSGVEPIPVEALFELLPPDKKLQAIKNAVSHGLVLKMPEVLIALDRPELKVQYLRDLGEPIPDSLLDKMAELAPEERAPEVALRYGALLYRYNRREGLNVLRTILARGPQRERRQAALVFALNRDNSAARDVVSALQGEKELEFDLLTALGRWPNRTVQRFLAAGFRQRKTDAAWALSIGLGNQREFVEEIGPVFELVPAEETDKLFTGAALSRLSRDSDHNPGIDFIIAQLKEPKGRYSPVFVVEALAYCDSPRAREALLMVLTGQKIPQVSEDPRQQDALARLMKAKAAVALSDTLDRPAAVSLGQFLSTAARDDFRGFERDRLLANIVQAKDSYELKDALVRVAPVSLILRMHAPGLRFLPDALLPVTK